MDLVDDIKSKVDIAELVSQYIPLKKAGRSFKGLCPFHNEKTPSFIVSPEKQLAYCFGCNRGGDIFRFIQEIEGVDFISVRIYYQADNGEWRPTKKGITVKPEKVDELIAFLSEAKTKIGEKE